MADSSSRIEQFKKMAEANPNDELGHFSLGRAYLDAGQFSDAVPSLERVIAINPNLSKTYQLLASALLKLDRREDAIARLTGGVKIADERGDLMPKNEMIKMLKELNAPVPELKQKAEQPVGNGELVCHRCGRVGSRLASPPYNNDYGKLIQSKICADCWKEWIGMGTKVINELRLPLADPQAQRVFAQHEKEFLNLE